MRSHILYHFWRLISKISLQFFLGIILLKLLESLLDVVINQKELRLCYADELLILLPIKYEE
jgi:hypothetical protein